MPRSRRSRLRRTNSPINLAPVPHSFLPRDRSYIRPSSSAITWFVIGAVQFATRPYFYADLSTTGYGAKGNLLQATLNYSRVSDRGSLVVRAGEMPTAFGSFMLRYDETSNPLVDVPPGYGYYYAPVSFLGVTGLQVDGSRGKFDNVFSSQTHLPPILAAFLQRTSMEIGQAAQVTRSGKASE